MARGYLASDERRLAVMSPAQQEHRRQYHAIRREDLRARGLCYDCGKRAPKDACLRCDDCLGRERLYNRTRNGRTGEAIRLGEKRRLWKAEGLCSQCGGERDRPGLFTCTKCTTYGKSLRVLDSTPVVTLSAPRPCALPRQVVRSVPPPTRGSIALRMPVWR